MKDEGKSLRFKIKSNSTSQTINFGKLFSKALAGGDVIVLEGALGGGKTTFTKGILAGLGYKKRVLSPSFTLLRQYDLKNLSVLHLDLYRLEFADVFDLGIDDFLYSKKSITLIEWGDKIKSNLDKYIRLEFIFFGENIRNIKFSTIGYPKSKLLTLERNYKKYV